MSQRIVKHVCDELENLEISCVAVNDDPRFKGDDVAKALGYKRHRNAIYDHMLLRSPKAFLIRSGRRPCRKDAEHDGHRRVMDT